MGCGPSLTNGFLYPCGHFVHCWCVFTRDLHVCGNLLKDLLHEEENVCTRSYRRLGRKFWPPLNSQYGLLIYTFFPFIERCVCVCVHVCDLENKERSLRADEVWTNLLQKQLNWIQNSNEKVLIRENQRQYFREEKVSNQKYYHVIIFC